MPDVVGLKIRVTQNQDGSLKYPKFRGEMDYYRNHPETKAGALHLDRTSGCKDETPGWSPLGTKWALKLVPAEFATEAVTRYPGTVEIISESEVEDFWNNRATVNVSEKQYDINELQGLKLEYELSVIRGRDTAELESRIDRALDENEGAPGVKKNKVKSWADFKKEKDLRIVAGV